LGGFAVVDAVVGVGGGFFVTGYFAFDAVGGLDCVVLELVLGGVVRDSHAWCGWNTSGSGMALAL